MSAIGNLMRSAANELNQYILAENERLAAAIHSQMETPPDYHDQQTCHELAIEANSVDELTARVSRLELALSKIEGWDQHDIDFSINKGSWGERDLYRDIARRALKEV